MKKSGGSMVLAVVLGILVVLGIAGNVFLFVSGKSGALRPDVTVSESGDSTGAKAESAVSEDSVEGTVQDFTVAKPGMAGSSQVSAEESKEYLCDYSSTREITVEDVADLKEKAPENLPVGMIQMVINELYAKKGFLFKNAEIQAWFDQKPWYQSITDRTDNMDVAMGRMSELEKKNIYFLNSHTQ